MRANPYIITSKPGNSIRFEEEKLPLEIWLQMEPAERDQLVSDSSEYIVWGAYNPQERIYSSPEIYVGVEGFCRILMHKKPFWQVLNRDTLGPFVQVVTRGWIDGNSNTRQELVTLAYTTPTPLDQETLRRISNMIEVDSLCGFKVRDAHNLCWLDT
jgi:hypothetical protein